MVVMRLSAISLSPAHTVPFFADVSRHMQA